MRGPLVEAAAFLETYLVNETMRWIDGMFRGGGGPLPDKTADARVAFRRYFWQLPGPRLKAENRTKLLFRPEISRQANVMYARIF